MGNEPKKLAKADDEDKVTTPSKSADLLRVEWPSAFPEVFFHVPWRGNTDVPCCLAEHKLYSIAKGQMLVDPKEALQAARSIINELHDERVYDLVDGYIRTDRETRILAPLKHPDVNSNALGIAYAYSLRQIFGYDVEENVFQLGTERRDQTTDQFTRMALPPVFAGEIKSGCDYILVDDVFTTGGTLAALRGFVHRHGGHVVVCSALAAGRRATKRAVSWDQRQMGVDLAPSTDTMQILRDAVGDEYRTLDSLFREGLRYGLQHLTEQEACFISQEASTIRGNRGQVAAKFEQRIIQTRSS